MFFDILMLMVYLGGVKLSLDYQAKFFTAYLWPWHLGKHIAYYVFAYKTMAETYQEQKEKKVLH